MSALFDDRQLSKLCALSLGLKQHGIYATLPLNVSPCRTKARAMPRWARAPMQFKPMLRWWMIFWNSAAALPHVPREKLRRADKLNKGPMHFLLLRRRRLQVPMEKKSEVRRRSSTYGFVIDSLPEESRQ